MSIAFSFNNISHTLNDVIVFPDPVEFEDPFTKQWKSFKAPLPVEFENFIRDNTYGDIVKGEIRSRKTYYPYISEKEKTILEELTARLTNLRRIYPLALFTGGITSAIINVAAFKSSAKII